MSYTVDLNAVPTTELAAPAVGVVVLDQQGYGPPGPQGDKGDPGGGVPPGGTIGQALVKNTSADYDTAWANAVTPALHADTHATGGTDPVTLAQSQVTGLTAALAAKATDSAVVHLAGTETVTGAKTFSSAVVVSGASVSVGTNPAQSGAVRLANSASVTARNAAGTADIAVIATDSSDNSILRGSANLYLQIGAVNKIVLHSTYWEVIDGYPLAFGTTSGSNIGTGPLQKMGFYGAVPIVRPVSTPAAATDPATTMALVNDLRAKLIALGLIG
jgi:hypothetical protein